MARPKKVEETTETEEKKGNIANIEALAMEFKRGRMPAPKHTALRKKLVLLYKEGVTTEDEQALMEAMIRKERSLGTALSADVYLLNSIEAERCEEKAVVKTDDAPTVLHLKKGLECRFEYDPDFNDHKGRRDSLGRYYVFVPRTIPTRHQLPMSTALKEEKGHPTSPEDYPEPYTVIHRHVLKVQEFNKWFEVVDEDILTRGSDLVQEEAYQF